MWLNIKGWLVSLLTTSMSRLMLAVSQERSDVTRWARQPQFPPLIAPEKNGAQRAHHFSRFSQIVQIVFAALRSRGAPRCEDRKDAPFPASRNKMRLTTVAKS